MKHQYSDVKEAIIDNKDKIDCCINSEEEEILKDLKKIYDLSLESYKRLINFFDLKSPLDIHLLLSYLLQKGYLSNNKSFKTADDNVVDIIIKENLAGVNIMCGEGVCRHASALFSDVFNNINFESKTLNCYLAKNGMKKTFYGRLKNYLETVGSLGAEQAFRLPYIEAIANHVILEVKDDSTKYYLDPINDSLLVPKEEEIGTLKSPGVYEVLVNKRVIEKNDFKGMEEYKEKRKKIKNLVSDNIDIFDHFHSINNIIYKEATSRIRKLDRKKIY